MDTEKVKEYMKVKIDAKMGYDYNVEETKMKKPAIKVVNIDWQEDESQDDSFVGAIYNQNESLNKT